MAAGPQDGAQLAEWLEGLGLADQLAAAGLPTYERGAQGVTWRDPATGEPLAADRLAELDALLRSVGEDPSHAVPVGLVRLRREARARAALLDGGWVDYAEVGRLRGVSENAARFALHKAAERRGVLLVQHEGDTLVPSFQLDASGQVREELLAVVEPLLAAGMDPWRAWIWLTSPAGLLGGAVPHEAARDAEELPLVQRAAVALAERGRADDPEPSAASQGGGEHDEAEQRQDRQHQQRRRHAERAADAGHDGGADAAADQEEQGRHPERDAAHLRRARRHRRRRSAPAGRARRRRSPGRCRRPGPAR